jgi:hypothetical protein
MATGDLIGWLAAALTLITFSMRSMIALRTAAISANICFLAYGVSSGLYPIAALHALLLPCNILRLGQLCLNGRAERARRPRRRKSRQARINPA